MREFCSRCRHTSSSASSSGSRDSTVWTSCSAASLSASCCSRILSKRSALSWFAFSLASSCDRWTATARSEFCRRACASCIFFCRKMSCEALRCSCPASCFSRICTNWLRFRSSTLAVLLATALARFCLSTSSRSCWIARSASFFSSARLRPSSIVAACRLTSSRSRQIFSSSRLKKLMRFSMALTLVSTAFFARLASWTVRPALECRPSCTVVGVSPWRDAFDGEWRSALDITTEQACSISNGAAGAGQDVGARGLAQRP
mmetsp:Transcript_63042/g.197402  ORF Transcript_63042/g.197402 Transcript_63042/m.197402 type:complete len:261 (-) Transcript_63042:7-789(-)